MSKGIMSLIWINFRFLQNTNYVSQAREAVENNEKAKEVSLNGHCNKGELSCDNELSCCSRVEAIIDILHKMRAQISDMDERCKRLETLYLNSS